MRHAARLKALSRKPTRHLHLYTSAVLGAILHLGETVISNGVVAFQSWWRRSKPVLSSATARGAAEKIVFSRRL
jgi:hypothetical protein